MNWFIFAPRAAGAVRHVLSPDGWAVFVVNEVDVRSLDGGGWAAARLAPAPVVVPPARMADVAGLCAESRVGVASVALGYAKVEPGPPWFELRLGWRRYWVRLVPEWGASAPLSAPAHRLYVLCGQRMCDLSPLFALADPLTWPRYASRVVRTYVDADVAGRWIPLCDVAKCGGDAFRALRRGVRALDILADPRRLRLLFQLVYDRRREVRSAGYRLELWSVDPAKAPDPDNMTPRGQFTLAASAALSYVAHMIPLGEVMRYMRLDAVKTL